jgi:serine/threonine-protein kinase
VIVQDDDVSDEGAAFLVMELLDGETLEGRRVRLGGKLPPDEVLRYAELVLEVLVAAHEQGIIHRDLKTENLFLTKDNSSVKVLDFGIARLRELSGASSATQTGSLLGTPAYMAPEQARGRWKDVDHATDLWAVGATMFTLLSGHAVHEAETASETLALAVTQPAPALATVAPTVDRRIAEIVDRALRYDKRDRYSTAVSMLEAVRAALAEVPDFSEAQTELSEQKVVPLAPLPPIPLPPPPLVASAATAVPESQEPITAPVPPIVGGKTTMTPGSMELTTTAQSAPRFANIFRPGGFNPPKLAVALVAAGAFLLGLFVLIGTLVATHRGDDDAPDVVVGAPATGSEVELAPLAPPPPTTPEVVPSIAEPPKPAVPKPETSATPKATSRPKPTSKTPVKSTTTKPQPTSDPWDIRGK